MNRCPITLEPCGDEQYSKRGLYLLSPRLLTLNNFPYTKQEQLEQAAVHANKISIQGVQPKLSVCLNVKEALFEVVDKGGAYILKPPHLIYPQLVENEDVSMRLAHEADIEIPWHGMIYAKDQSLTYVIRRFDRVGRGQKLAVEDFTQLSLKNRETKYDSSMEQVASLVEKFCTFPLIEKLKLFRLTLFSFLIGNEDMHLKNFSLIRRSDKNEFSPAYDLLNTSIVLQSKEELALPLMGKKSGLTRNHFVRYFARERLALSTAVVAKEMERFREIHTVWLAILAKSFLSSMMQEKYVALILARQKRLFD